MVVSEMQPSVPEILVWVVHRAGTFGRKMSEASVLSLRHEEYWKPQFFISLIQFHSIQFIFVHFMRQPM